MCACSRSMFTYRKKLRKMADKTSKVLVSFVKDNTPPVKANFTESILDTLGLITGHDMNIYAELKEDTLLLGNKQWSSKLKAIKMRRPPFCPIHNMNSSVKHKLQEEVLSRGINVGCAVIVETSDNKVLLTRRAGHLRTFPNVWVPPGGHIEVGETLGEAGLRELKEETGLVLSPSDYVQKDLPILALWESSYPTMLSLGLPIRHHAVVYLYAKLASHLTSSVLQEKLKLDPGEVGAATWLDRKMARSIVMVTEETPGYKLPDKIARELPETFRALVVQEDQTMKEEDLPTSVFFNTAVGNEKGVERVSIGTKFALEQWLHKKQTTKTRHLDK